MRIITGKYRGRILTAPKDAGVRPATDKARGSIFNILQNRLDIAGIDVLDLFAGTGSLGFEAISRGAAGATFVDDSRAAVKTIRNNAEVLGCAECCDIFEGDALRYISGNSGIFKLIFADPPYAWPGITELPSVIHRAGILAPGGYLIMEHGRRSVFSGEAPLLPRFQRTFGNTVVSFFIFA